MTLAEASFENLDVEKISWVFEHSITWEDDVWKADPFDVEQVHMPARRAFLELLSDVAGGRGGNRPRILLFHGQSGAGKTHLIRALRTYSHAAKKGYFGYAQMTPDVSNYAEYFLRRLINSLDKPYQPLGRAASGLLRLSNKLAEDPEILAPELYERLQEEDLGEQALADLVTELADEIVVSPKLAEHDLDINIVRALLYLQRSDPRVDQRIRQYLYGRQLNDLSSRSVSALDPNVGEDRPFEIMESLGRLMHAIDGAALVFCIDQVEDLRFFDDATERFQKACRDLIQLANRIPTSIVLISCLGDFYEHVRGNLPQSYIDRIEKSGPQLLSEARTRDEVQLIIDQRLRSVQAVGDTSQTPMDAKALFGDDFMDQIAGLSTRKVLESVHGRWRQMNGEEDASGFQNVPAGSADMASSPAADVGAFASEAGSLEEAWDRFTVDFQADIPTEEAELSEILTRSLLLAQQEIAGDFELGMDVITWIEDVMALDLVQRFPDGHAEETRIFLCNKASQGGALKRQMEKALSSTEDKPSVILRAGEFPPNPKSATSKILREFMLAGGRKLVVPSYEWERMMEVQAFHAQMSRDPRFMDWLSSAKMLSDLPSIGQILRLGLHALPADGLRPQVRQVEAIAKTAHETPSAPQLTVVGGADVSDTTVSDVDAMPEGGPDAQEPVRVETPANAVAPQPTQQEARGWFSKATASILGGFSGKSGGDQPSAPRLAQDASQPPVGGPEDPLDLSLDDVAAPPPPLEAILTASSPDSLVIGRDKFGHMIECPKSLLKRHCAVLGGSGSGKTTLALSLIEQLLTKDIPVVLIDRKGDLSSYANPDVWRNGAHEPKQRCTLREELGSSIDVAVYTPGQTSGRPIGITLLPNGISELPEHEQQQLANVSAAALADMLHLKNSATHQRQGGVLSVALKILGATSSSEVTLADLIYLLETEDMELTELTQRMDPSGKLRRDLIAQLDSLRHRNWALFEGGGEPLRMESLLGRDAASATGRNRLSIVYTGFLGDNQNILFWVSQFLTEALRFCQRNPADELQAVIMFDEADLYIPANAKPATKEPLESLLKRARSAGIGIMLATQSPGDLDYKSRDQITSWFIGKVREDTALKKLKAAFASDSGIDPAMVLPNQGVGEFHLIQEGTVQPVKSQMSLVQADQVPFDRIEQLARETRGDSKAQLDFKLE